MLNGIGMMLNKDAFFFFKTANKNKNVKKKHQTITIKWY